MTKGRSTIVRETWKRWKPCGNELPNWAAAHGDKCRLPNNHTDKWCKGTYYKWDTEVFEWETINGTKVNHRRQQ